MGNGHPSAKHLSGEDDGVVDVASILEPTIEDLEEAIEGQDAERVTAILSSEGTHEPQIMNSGLGSEFLP